MLAYMTGSRTEPVLLTDLDLPYPSTWEELIAAYAFLPKCQKVLLLVRTFSEKYQRAKIILSNLGRILRINFPTTCREYKTHFQPSWSEV